METSAYTDFDFAQLQKELTRKGAWRVLPADLSALPAEQRDGLPRGVSISVALDLSIVNRLPISVTSEYVDECERVNLLLDQLADTAAEQIRSAGYRAFSLSRNNVTHDRNNHATLLPYKTVATRAGLGWIGKNALLITRERGSALRLTAVLTDAPLPCAEPINESHCGDCEVCLRNCPGQAILGPNWSPESKREDFYSAFSCRKACIERTWNVKPGVSYCGLCITVCPHTQKAIRAAGIDYGFPAPVFAGPEDFNEILSLQKLCFQREVERSGNPNISPMIQTAEELSEDYYNARSPLFLLKLVEDKRIVGSVRARQVQDATWIGRLFVHPDYQRRGYGRKLMEGIEKCFHHTRYELFTGKNSEDNIHFYRNLGYRICGEMEADGVSLVRLEKHSDPS